jgi:uncharacterized protein (TIGR02266 family)
VGDDPKSAGPAPVVLRIKVRYEDPDAFVERFAPYCARAGLFLRSKTPRGVGTEVRFELRLADDRPVLVGMGKVKWSREHDPARPYAPPGMAIEFTRVTKESRGVILKILELRRKLELRDGPGGLPEVPDDDHPVTAATTAAATAAQVRTESPPATPTPATAPVVTRPIALTPSSPTWQRPAVATLEPLPARARRPAAAEIAAQAAATPIAAGASFFDDLDAAEADLPGVLARARALLGGADVDAELGSLLDDQAVPVETPSIEDVSARLASLLGTAPVPSRRRKADDSVPVESKPAFAPPPKVAVQISADLVPAAEVAEAAPTIAKRSEAPGGGDPAGVAGGAGVLPRGNDPERTKVVSVETLAALTATPAEAETRVVRLEPLAAVTAQRDEDERTRVVVVRDDAQTHVVQPGAIVREEDAPEDNTLDFDRPRPATSTEPARDGSAVARSQVVPRDFADDPEPDTFVKARPTPPAGLPTHGRPARRTQPPPPPPRSARRTQPPPPPAPAPAREPDDDAVTPAPIDPRVTSSGSIDLTDLVTELESEAAQPVPLRRRSPGDSGDLGRSLGGEALDAAGLLADLDELGRPPPPSAGDGAPFPDLASFADPPTTQPRTGRMQALDAALDSLADDGEGEVAEPTSYERPSSHSGMRPTTDGDGFEIEIEVDHDDDRD